MMQVTQEQITPCEIELQIELEAAELENAYEKTFQEAAQKVAVKGFRKGKAPRSMIEKYVDLDKVMSVATDELLRPAYAKALEENGIQPVAAADVEIIKAEIGQPLVFKARVPLAPKVELGDYVGLEVERKVIAVTDEQVEEELQRLIRRHAEYPEITDRPAALGDIAVVETKDESKEGAESQRDVARIGDNYPEFDAALVGMSAGEEKIVDIKYPEDHQSEDLRGKTIPFRTTLVELREEKLPELSDDWVRQVFVGELPDGELAPPDAVDTVEKLRQRIKSAIEKELQERSDEQVREDLLRKVIESSTVCFPFSMVEERVAKRFQDLASELKSRQVTLEDYLEKTGRTLEQIRDEYEASVRRGLTSALVIGEIVAREGLTVEEADLDAEIEAIAAARRTTTAGVRALLDSTGDKDALGNRILFKKAMDFLVHASNIKNVSVDAEAS